MDAFLKGYLETAIWLLEEESHSFSVYDIEDISEAQADCKLFNDMNRLDLDICYYATTGYTPARAGHDLWLTRNGHGAGFWDRDLGDMGERLSKSAQQLGQREVYVGDDGKLYYGRG